MSELMEIEPNTSNTGVNHDADKRPDNTGEIKEEKSIYDLDNKEYRMLEETDNVKDKKLYNNAAIVFRNRVYRILNSHYSYYKMYDYFESKHYYDKHGEAANEKRIHGSILHIYDAKQKLEDNKYDGKFNTVTYDQFMSEIQIITHDEVPSYMMKCIKNIQESKVVQVIPYEKIKEHENYHTQLLKEQLDYFLHNIVSKIFDALDSEKKMIEVICTRFYVSEHSMERKAEIMYEFPNSDGVKRETFMEYVYYLFEKLYPKPITEELINAADWFFNTTYELLCAEYPMLNIYCKDNKYYIDLQHPKVLH